jgi:hypothetical protein
MSKNVNITIKISPSHTPAHKFLISATHIKINLENVRKAKNKTRRSLNVYICRTYIFHIYMLTMCVYVPNVLMYFQMTHFFFPSICVSLSLLCIARKSFFFSSETLSSVYSQSVHKDALPKEARQRALFFGIIQ